ncbi:hypothetical protein GRJ2_001215400 [Grus japonensis]|uniref:Uncharacterized protein n=1 Tax=Grus japonensis TaxID=30415 RepID=A0ABC9WQE5_GRUJA
MNAIQKRGACFRRNGCTGASAKECEGVLQSETLCFSEVTLNLAPDPNIEWKSGKQHDLQDVKHDWENPALPLSSSENGLFPCGCYLCPIDVR